jgi:hypothetical protein
MATAIVLMVSLLLFAAGIWIAATQHWLWTLSVRLLPPLMFKLFFMTDVLEKIAAGEAAPVTDIVWFLTAGPVGVVVGALIKAFNK